MNVFIFCVDHSLWPGELPGEASWIYLSLPEHHGVWCWQHPFPQGGVWSVSNRDLSAFPADTLLAISSSCWWAEAAIIILLIGTDWFSVWTGSVLMVVCASCVFFCPSACCGQLGRIWTLQLLWAAVCAGERRVSSLGIMERQQRLPHWEDDVLPPHLFSCEILFAASLLIFTFDSDRKHDLFLKSQQTNLKISSPSHLEINLFCVILENLFPMGRL